MTQVANEHDARTDGLPAQLPALLVAGGSCSRLCRALRATEPDDARPVHRFDEEQAAFRTPKEIE